LCHLNKFSCSISTDIYIFYKVILKSPNSVILVSPNSVILKVASALSLELELVDEELIDLDEEDEDEDFSPTLSQQSSGGDV
jgi:hypothetical protein